jgi:hypothetical protein
MTFGNIVGATAIAPATATAPTPSSTSATTYIYSVIGNTMYVKFNYYYGGSTNGASGGSLAYFYNLPTNFTMDTTNLIAGVGTFSSGNNTTDFDGTQIGTAFITLNTNRAWGIVVPRNNSSMYLHMHHATSSDTYFYHSSYYPFNGLYKVTFEASFPIV